MYTLFTVIQESKFMREYIWYFGYYFASICAWKVFLFCTKIVQKTSLFPTEQVTIQCPQENSPKTALKCKSSHFSLCFCPRVIFNYNNSIQTSCGHHLYLWLHFTILKNILIYLSKYVKSVVTHFQFTTKMSTLTTPSAKK